MKFVQLIFSPTGGTEKAAKLILSEWSGTVETIDLTDPAIDFSGCEIGPDDIALIALPSYGGRVPALAAGRLSQVRGNSAKCVLLCVYGNRAYEDTLVEMEDLAKKCGFTVAAAVSAVAEHSIMHQFASGRPDEEDARQLKSFAKSILEKIEAGRTGSTLQIPGSRPYKKTGSMPLVPKADKRCTGCGICAENCPAGAISKEDLKTADSGKCIACMRCVAGCPQSARKVNGALVSAASLAIKKACSERKAPELFLWGSYQDIEPGTPYELLCGCDTVCRDALGKLMAERPGCGPGNICRIGAAAASNSGPKAAGISFTRKKE